MSDFTSSFTELLSELLFFFFVSFLDLAFSRRLRRNPETAITGANIALAKKEAATTTTTAEWLKVGALKRSEELLVYYTVLAVVATRTIIMSIIINRLYQSASAKRSAACVQLQSTHNHKILVRNIKYVMFQRDNGGAIQFHYIYG